MSHGHGPSRTEPFFWTLFGAGGVASALFVPGLILSFGVLIPLGILPATASDPAKLTMLFQPFLVRLVLTGIASLTFFHWAHRFRFAVYDLGMKSGRTPMAFVCYGTALWGTLWTAKSLLLPG